MGNHFADDRWLTLHLILANATDRRPFEREGVDGRNVHYVPFDIVLWDDGRHDAQLIDYLAKETKNKGQVILHFN